MPKPQFTAPVSLPELRQLLELVVSLIDWPAAIVADGEDVFVSNEHWRRITRCSNESDTRLPLERSLQDFSGVDGLVAKLLNRQQDTGAATMHRVAGDSSTDESRNDYEVRWRQIHIPSQHDSLAIVTLQSMADGKHPSPIMELQQSRIDRLLVRQTLIEESERRRLGRALHDVVVQDLAQVRAAIRSSGIAAGDSAKIIAGVDRIIDEVRTLTFELGPPILEDLGLRPSLQWLAEHLSERYSANITMDDDKCDPRLSKPTQTIIFRAVRELAINAAKHAPGAENIISCVTNQRLVRIIVRDTGPGFDTTRAHDAKDDIKHYGLISVEQQVRGVGGAFNIVSELGEGTRATITAPLEME